MVFETLQSKLVLAFNLLAGAIILGVLLFQKQWVNAAITSTSFFFFALIGSFLVNCLIIGDCGKYSWFITVLSIVVAMGAVGLVLLNLFGLF